MVPAIRFAQVIQSFVIAIVLTGCTDRPQEAPAATVKTLDNFAAGTTVTSLDCRAAVAIRDGVPDQDFLRALPLSGKVDVADSVAEPDRAQLLDAARVALSGLPKSFQKMYADLDGSRIVITAETSSACPAAEAGAETGDGCYTLEEDAEGYAIPTLYLRGSRNAIRHSAVPRSIWNRDYALSPLNSWTRKPSPRSPSVGADQASRSNGSRSRRCIPVFDPETSRSTPRPFGRGCIRISLRGIPSSSSGPLPGPGGWPIGRGSG